MKRWSDHPAYPHVLMLVQTLTVAPGYIFGKPATMAFPIEVLMPIRIVGASLFYWLLLFLTNRNAIQAFRPTRGQWKQFFGFALVGTVLNQLTFMMGLRFTTPAHSALLFALVPMLVVVISVLILKSERMNIGKAAGILLALMGVSWVIYSSQPGTVTASDVWLGDGITILSVLCWAVYMSNSRQLVQQFEPLTFITVLMTVGALIVLPIGIYPALTYDYSQISTEAWWGYVYLTIGSSAVSYLLLVFALKKMHASRVAIYINAQPVFTTLISLSIGTDEPSWSFLTGGLLVVTGIYVLNRARF